MSKKLYTADSITVTANKVGTRIYVGLNFSYGFITETNGVRKYRSFKMATGVNVDQKDWASERKEGALKNKAGWFASDYIKRHKKFAMEQQASIIGLKEKVIGIFNDLLLEQDGALPTPEEIAERVAGKENTKKSAAVRVVDYAREYLDTIENVLTRKKFRTLCVMLECFEQLRGQEQFKPHRKNDRNGVLYLHLFDRDMWTEFSNMIDHAAESIPECFERSGIEGIVMVDRGFYKTSTKNKYQSALQTLIKQAQEDGHRTTINTATCKLAPCKSDNGSYLKASELAILLEAKLEDARLENSRKLFALTCLLGNRFGDLKQILEAPILTIKGDEISFPAIQYGSKKKGIGVCMPLFHHALHILKHDKPYHVDNATLDLDVHEIARVLKLDRVQQVAKYFADGRTEFLTPTLDLELTVHSGRRTMITLCCSAPLLIAPAIVSRASGHTLSKDRSSFDGYFSLTCETAAEQLLLVAHRSAHRLPFKLLPDAVTAQIDAIDHQRARVA